MRFEDGSVLIEPLAAHHDRSAFSCGNELLDRYLREQAGQDTRRGTTRVFIATLADQPQNILGFYTLSAASIVATELPPTLARKLPRHPVPAALIGRLAVDRSVSGRGLGGILIADAIQRTMLAAQSVAMAVVVVDPIDETARGFYAAFGFQSLQGTERRMFLSLRFGA